MFTSVLLNLPRAITYLERYHLDALVAASWQNILYLSDFFIWLQPVFREYMAKPGASDDGMALYAWITRDGSAGLVIDPICELIADSSWVPNRYVFGDAAPVIDVSQEDHSTHGGFQRSPYRFDSPIEALATALKVEQLMDARIGLDMAGMPAHRIDALKATLPRAELLDSTNLFRLIRMVKSEEEINRLRRAAEINERSAIDRLKTARPGDNIQRVSQDFQASVAGSGAVFDHFAFSQRGIGFATEGDYKLPIRETMFIDFGCIFRHYYSDAGTTLILGDYGDIERAGYRALVDCLNETALRMHPGATASSIQDFMQRFLDSNGLSGQFPHGHGIGIEHRDYPILSSHGGRRIRDDCVDVSADLPLEQGMVINLEAPVFEWNGAALQLEQTYVVTANGAEPLTNRNLFDPVLVGG